MHCHNIAVAVLFDREHQPSSRFAIFEQHRFSCFHFIFTECLGLFSYKVQLDNLKVSKCVDTSSRSMFPNWKYHFSCQIPQERSTGWVRPSGSWLPASLLLLLTLVVTQLLSLYWHMRFHHILNSLQRRMALIKQIFHTLYIKIKAGLGSSRNIAAVLPFLFPLSCSRQQES